MHSSKQPNDHQVGGTHYKAAVQHWDFVANRNLDYFQAQIVKYVSRWRKKNGVQDLNKAHHFLTKMLELHKANRLPWNFPAEGAGNYPVISCAHYAEANDLTPAEAHIVTLVVEWDEESTRLHVAMADVEALIAGAEDGSGPTSAYVDQ